jgi:hypothetical protein
MKCLRNYKNRRVQIFIKKNQTDVNTNLKRSKAILVSSNFANRYLIIFLKTLIFKKICLPLHAINQMVKIGS